MEEDPPKISSTWFTGLTATKSTKTTDVMSYANSISSPTMYKVDNTVAQAGVVDDSYWRTIHINSENGTVCSYRLLNQNDNVNANVFELKLSDLQNVQIGLYYGQHSDHGREALENEDREEEIKDFQRFVDMKIFDPEDCGDILHCTVSGEDKNYIQFMLSKAEFVSLNLLPANEAEPMLATVSYRLINQDEFSFII